MNTIKNLFRKVCSTVGVISSTAADSFMEGWKNPYIPVEEVDVVPPETNIGSPEWNEKDEAWGTN